MRRFFWFLVSLAACALCGVIGFSIGAYLQFLQTEVARQYGFAQSVMAAQSIETNQTPQLIYALKLDAPTQYHYLVVLENLRAAPLPLRLALIAQLTWNLRATTYDALRSAASLKRMVDQCSCGLEVEPAVSFDQPDASSPANGSP